MRVVQITAHFSPNVGGVETHLSDLVEALKKRDWQVTVLTYQPLTANAKAPIWEEDKNIRILRIPWLKGLFYKLTDKPMLEFLYLLPGLFIACPFFLLRYNPQVIHAHGLVASFVAVFWGKFFNKRVVLSTHNIYHFPKGSIYTSFVRFIFNLSDQVLCLSNQSAREVKSIGTNPEKIKVFTYWIDLKRFQPLTDAKIKLKLSSKFTVLFVGRLVAEKGVKELLEAAKTWNKDIQLLLAGVGPLSDIVVTTDKKYPHIKYLGALNQDILPVYYNCADLLIIPSVHEEGFGRVILEALACGTPIVGSNRGAIPEAIDETVGQLINVSPKSIKDTIEGLFKNPKRLKKMASNARLFAQRRYSEKNISVILKAYQS